MIAPAEFLESSLAGLFSSPTFAGVMVMKATLVLVGGGLVVGAAHSAGAATRHAILAVTLAAALALPLGMIATPAWTVRMLPQKVERNSEAQSARTLSPESRIASGAIRSDAGSQSAQDGSGSPRNESAPSRSTVDNAAPHATGSKSAIGWLFSRGFALWIPLLWAAGAVAVLLWMSVGRFSLYRLARKAIPLNEPRWRDILAEEKARAGVNESVPLLSSLAVTTPLTWGIRSRVILLPAEADEWPDAHRVVVLRHELAHIARGDSLVQMLAGLTSALYWFHPLVWVVARKLRVEQERACDDRVLSSGTPRAEYAAHLLEVARSARALGAHGLVSLAMARPSQLEGRLLAVLNQSRLRTSVPLGVRLSGTVIAAAAFFALSAFHPIPRAALHAVVTPTIIASQFMAPRSSIETQRGGTISLPGAAPTRALDSVFESSVVAATGGTLVLDLNTGAGLTITGWDQPRVRVSGTLSGRDWRDTEVRLERVGSGARLTTRHTGHSPSQSTSHHFDIKVPRRFNIRLSSAGGGVTISGVDGEFVGNTGGGPLVLERATGHADLGTGGGNIRVTSSNLSGSLNTGGGTVQIQNGSRGLRGHSGSGPVVYIDNDSVGEGYGTVSGTSSSVTINDATGEIRDNNSGRIIFRKSGGRIDLTETMQGADVRTAGGPITIGRTAGDVVASTGGGDVTIGRSGGDVKVTTGGGEIRLGPVNGSAEAQTGKGDVTITLDGAAGHTVNVRSGTGRVVLIVPANLSAILDLETAYTDNLGRRTRIVSDWPLPITETSYWDATNGTPRKYVRARQTIGRGGALIRVRTVNGDVVVQRR